MERAVGEYVISTDPSRLDLDVVHRFLAFDSYWARGVPRAVVERAVRHSFCVGVYRGDRQVGFGRVVTDYATFGHIMDVFILPAHRGQGLSKALMECIMRHPDLQGFRLWTLGTADAHSLYARFGFAAPAHPERVMQILDADVYQQSNDAPEGR